VSDQQPATSRWGCLLVLGIILLLPGVCSLLFAQAGWVMHTGRPGTDLDPDNVIWTACLVIGAGGATLITLAIWRGRRVLLSWIRLIRDN
jgi:hypothetical protein